MAILDMTRSEITEIHDYISTLLGGMDVDVDVSEKEVEVLACKALKDYLYEIQTWQLKNQFSNIVGQPASVDFTNKFISDNTVIAQRISDWFASMQRVGGKIPWKRDYFTIQNGRQTYNLAHESGVPYIEGQRRIHRVMWVGRPEMFNNYQQENYNDPGVLTFTSAGLSIGSAPLMYLGNLFDYVMLGQAFEMRNKVLRSEHFFNISGDMIEVTPLRGCNSPYFPDGSKVFYYYFDETDFIGLGEDGQIKNQSDVNALIATPFQVKIDRVPYSTLNSLAKNWIENYIVALAKYMQASKWRKVRSIASPDSTYQIEFDYQSLIEESKTMQEDLKQKLQDNLLNALDTVKMMEDKASIVDNATRINNKGGRLWAWY